MKKLILVAAMLLITTKGFAYSSNAGSDPTNGFPDRETRAYVKSSVAGFSDAISKGDVLEYDQNLNDGYTMTRVGSNKVLNTALKSCIAMDSVATGDGSYHTCVTKGFVDFVSYDATTAIQPGMHLCSNGVGRAVVCAACTSGEVADVNNCRFGPATPTAGIISLSTKASGTGTTLKALIELQ